MAYDCKRTAERLKDLRKQKGISHDKLSMAIKEQYGVNISKGTLINYENSEDFGVKAGSAKGMSAERLAVLADFFGVTTDYLLGLSDIKSTKPDIQVSASTLGISSEAAENLATLAKQEACTYYLSELARQAKIDALNAILESPNVRQIAESARMLMHLGREDYLNRK